ncbi:MAG: hypothetical protein D6705_13810 [Deltaproteobacteria bacterium]|nr:MAG: hypothetical protein D6705_13810 [Deltaproteobacteria bacterium]
MARRPSPSLVACIFALAVGCAGDDGDTSGGSTAGSTGGTSAGTAASSAGSTAGSTSDASATAGSTAGSAGSAGTTGGAAEGTWELRIDDHPLSTQETDYVCFEFTVPVDQLTHVTGFTPVIDNVPYVHHYVVTLLDQPTGNQGYPCYDLTGDLAWAWAPGVEDFAYPDDVGLLVGDTGDSVTFRIQVHYNNPLGVDGQTDASGLDVHWTTNLRTHNAGTLVVAQVNGFMIPPGEPNFEHEVRCDAQMTNAIFSGPINVIGSALHAHEIGKALFAEHWVGGQLAQTFNQDDPYSFEYQNYKEVSLTISPGDEIVTRCFYDSTDRTEPTYGGEGTSDEMCWNTLVYYPRENVAFPFCGPG